MQHFASIILLVLTTNLFAGLLGLQLAIPPGYATAIWPPSGIALAAALIWQTPGLIGVWLASFLTNIIHQYGISDASAADLLAPAWIACTSTLQASLGAFLIRRYIGYPTRLNKGSTILRFLLLAGPVSCLIAPTLNTAYLTSSGLLSIDSAQINWLTWWIGDSIGVIIFAPLMFLGFALPRHHWRLQRIPVGLPLALVVIFTLLMYRQGLEKELENQKAQFDAQTQALRLAVQAEIDAHANLLYTQRGFIYSNPNLNPAEYQRFAAEALTQQKSLHGMSWNTYLKHHERDAFTARMQGIYQGTPFAIQERHPVYGLVPAENRPSYVVVTLIAPFNKNQAALGFDILSSPSRQVALEKAVKSGLVSATAPIRLVQETGEQNGTLIFLPVFKDRATPDTESGRLKALAGYSVAVVRLGDLVSHAVQQQQLGNSFVKLYPAGAPDTPYYVGGEYQESDTSPLTNRSEVKVGIDTWVLEHKTSRQQVGYSWGLYYVLIGGLVISSVFTGILLLLAGRSADSYRELHQRTKALKKSNALLAESQRIASMGSWEWPHSGQGHQWSGQFYRLLDLSPEKHTASEALFLKQITPSQHAAISQALEDALKGKPLDIECTLRGKGLNGYRYLQLKGELILTGEGQNSQFLSIVARDITAQHQAAQELELAAITFETHEAIVITDASTTIQRINTAFSQITGYSSDEVVGQKINILRSGRHGDNFYRELWQSLNLQGHWHGEIWNKRKDGSIFPELVTITAVDTLGLGSTTHYVAAFLDITDKKASEEKIRYLAYYDSITELPNRDLFMESLRHQIAHCERHKDFNALMFMDLDNFKTLNDSLGHDMGDRLLKSVADRLTDTLRAEDIFSRFGGDEFLFLLPASMPSVEQAMDQAGHVAERILNALEQPFDLKGHSHKVSASIGITYLPQPETEAEGYIQQADTAMYRAKSAGKASFALYEPQMQAEVIHRLQLEKSIRIALEEDQFTLFYQPQHDSSGRMTGCEALIRWHHPEEGLITPGAFIHVAEESSLIIDLGLQVLEKACGQIQRWQGTTLAECDVSVNISSRHFAHPAFTEQVSAVLDRYPAAKNRLWIEITEGVFLKSGKNLNKTLAALKALGVLCSIDDFGTGYSSLSYLKKLDIQQIKIAQEFVRDLAVDEKDAQLVKAILQMGQSLELELVAEGVETEAQYNFLRQLGCPCYQGYWFARPMPAEELLGYSHK